MKYKILKEFLPNVIVGQECEVLEYGLDNTPCIGINTNLKYEKYGPIIISEKYSKQYPSIFQPIEELKENETEFESISGIGFESTGDQCMKCGSVQMKNRNFCSNCGRKRVDK